MYYESHFMVDCTLPEELNDEFFDLLPYQDGVVNRYLANGKLLHYALSLETGKLWATFSANSELEVREMLLDFPLTRLLRLEIILLTCYNAMHAGAAHFSLN